MSKYGFQSASVSGASSGSNEVVAAVSGRKITVHGYTLVAAGAVTVQWRSAATAKTGVMSLAANGTVSAYSPTADMPLFQTAEGEALNLQLGGAVQVSGHLVYTTEQA